MSVAMSEMLTAAQAAARLGVSTARIQALLREGRIAYVTDHRGWKLIPISEVVRFAEERNARLRARIVDLNHVAA